MAKEIVMTRRGRKYRVLLNKDGTFRKWKVYIKTTGKVGITLKSKAKGKVKAKEKRPSQGQRQRRKAA